MGARAALIRQVVSSGILYLDKSGFRAYLITMKTQSPSLFACLLVGLACLAWVGGISWAIIYFLGLSATVGWCIVGSLGFSVIVAVTIILYEMRHAVEFSRLSEPIDTERPPVESPRGLSSGLGTLTEGGAPSFRVTNKLF